VWRDLCEQLQVERQQIDELFVSHARVLEAPEDLDPDQIEISALAAFLHTLYGGIENCFRRIVVELDDEPPSGEMWHRALLRSMTVPTDNRPRVISDELHERLLEYLRFRHLFRHLYLMKLDWQEMKHLVIGVGDVVEVWKAELDAFALRMDEKRET
jgi:hypothetical protein